MIRRLHPAAPALLALIAAAVQTARVQADVVAARGSPPLISTQVLRLEAGRLICRDGGGEIGFAVEQVDYIQITGWQMFNLAEKQRRAEDWRRAAVSYEQALVDLQTEPPAAGDALGRPLDRPLLVKCRLIPAWDAQERLERATELYLEAIERMPELTDALRPTQFPETGSAVLEMAAKQVRAAIERHGDDVVGRSLGKWLSTWPVQPATRPWMSTDAPVPPPADNREREQIESVAEWIRAGNNARALERIDELHRQVEPALRGDLFYWQARALEAVQARTGSAKTNANKTATHRAATTQPDLPTQTLFDTVRAKAAAPAVIAYMRVVVHFPRHPLAAECLYRAADLCRGAGDRTQAAALWSELSTVYPHVKGPDGKAWADLAREELKE